jgi:tetratricopeptide (TPR) repeat protein
MAELLQYYRQLPPREPEEETTAWLRRLGEALTTFDTLVQESYLEGTLQRVLNTSSVETRQAAVLALGRQGTMSSNRLLARMLRDRDDAVRQLANDALWAIWCRSDTPEHNQELIRLSTLTRRREVDEDQLLADYAELIRKAPGFAEAYNQRAILHFRLGGWDDAIADCERVLRLNPYHFGAASGMAQCFLKQKKTRAALRAYRRAYQINPNLAEVKQVIRSLERMLDEEGKT